MGLWQEWEFGCAVFVSWAAALIQCETDREKSLEKQLDYMIVHIP